VKRTCAPATGNWPLADADPQRAGQGDQRWGVGRIGLDALAVAADVVELGQFGQAGEERAAVRSRRPGAGREFEQGEPGESAQYAGRGTEGWLAALLRPFDGAVAVRAGISQ
jgi:hypothetical protein